MRSITLISSLLLLLTAAVSISAAAQTGAARVPGDFFHSVLPEVEGEPIRVDDFMIDRTAVTVSDFLRFLEENPEWRRSQVPAVFTGPGYLRNWNGDLDPATDAPEQQPVTRVSWFAAQSYCQWAGGRLPTLNEWEYSAQLMKFDSKGEMKAFANRLMGWYSAVDAQNTDPIGSTGIETVHGVKDQFGLIMEWVEDFSPPVGDEISLDCGTVGRMQQLGNTYSYAASVRYITRMSFNPKAATGMMGFRCAYDVSNNDTIQ
jgi:formylglycine-generating enzyme required for sulfatase activity